MKIAFFSGDITRSGGTERVATTIAQSLFDMKQYDISIISLTEALEQPFFKLNPEIKRTFFSKKWINPGPGYLIIILKLIKYIRKNKIDIVIDIDGVLDILSIRPSFLPVSRSFPGRTSIILRIWEAPTANGFVKSPSDMPIALLP